VSFIQFIVRTYTMLSMILPAIQRIKMGSTEVTSIVKGQQRTRLPTHTEKRMFQWT
jgi:hypothetical protein